MAIGLPDVHGVGMLNRTNEIYRLVVMRAVNRALVL